MTARAPRPRRRAGHPRIPAGGRGRTDGSEARRGRARTTSVKSLPVHTAACPPRAPRAGLVRSLRGIRSPSARPLRRRRADLGNRSARRLGIAAVAPPHRAFRRCRPRRRQPAPAHLTPTRPQVASHGGEVRRRRNGRAPGPAASENSGRPFPRPGSSRRQGGSGSTPPPPVAAFANAQPWSWSSARYAAPPLQRRPGEVERQMGRNAAATRRAVFAVGPRRRQYRRSSLLVDELHPASNKRPGELAQSGVPLGRLLEARLPVAPRPLRQVGPVLAQLRLGHG